MKTTDLLVVLGPTASGKTKLAAHLAYAFKSAILSADSRQVYKNMNIGTGKDYEDYTVNGKPIAHYLIDMVEAGEKYNLSRYLQDFTKTYTMLRNKNIIPILCGGTGLYIQAAISNFQYSNVPKNYSIIADLGEFSHKELIQKFTALPQNAYTAIADLSTKKRCLRAIEIATHLNTQATELPTSSAINSFIIGIKPTRENRINRIKIRLKSRLETGLIEEVKNLLQQGITHELLRYYGLEYKFISMYLTNELTKTAMEEKLATAIMQYAKRQMTYFRKMEKDGLNIHWIDGDLPFEEQLHQSKECIQQTLKY